MGRGGEMTTRSTRHPFDGSLYELQPDGNIKISDGDRQGLFGPDGQWISGELRQSDPQLCVWVGNNPEMRPGCRFGFAPRRAEDQPQGSPARVAAVSRAGPAPDAGRVRMRRSGRRRKCRGIRLWRWFSGMARPVPAGREKRTAAPSLRGRRRSAGGPARWPTVPPGCGG